LQDNVGSLAVGNTREEQALRQAAVLLPAAVNAYRAGRHSESQLLCRAILRDLPDHFDALQLLGLSEADGGQLEQAVITLKRAAEIDPCAAGAQFKLGWLLLRLGRPQDARAYLDRAIALKPDHADAYCNRGLALMAADCNVEAERDFDRALLLDPQMLAAMVARGIVNIRLRNYDLALLMLNTALAAKPDAAPVLAQRGRLFQDQGQHDKAEADFEAALRLDPNLEPALCGQANAALQRGLTAQSMAACHKALGRNPNSEVALTVLGSCYASQGDHKAAIACFDRALAIKPDHESAILCKIFAMDFVPGMDFVQHQEPRNFWWRSVGSKLPRRQLGELNLDPDRRLVVGYVSSDFRTHSAAFAFLPLLRHHDRSRFEIIAYSCHPKGDETTEQCRALVDRWVDARQLHDDGLADRIQADKVDILVDLSGHTGGNRLTVFARKPAPVQVSAVGHVTGTGIPVMDYLLADRVLIPPEVRYLFAEEVYDLPCCITIAPPPDVPASPLPMIRNGYVTFGVFNRIDKISDVTLALWSRLMQALPTSRIMVKHPAIDEPTLCERLLARFGIHGIAADRVRLVGNTSRQQHLATFVEIDMSLDPFPQNGGVSTWESLQMGVPVISMLGRSAGGRVGGAIIKAVGLHEWVADDDDGYIAVAQRFTAAPNELAAIRANLPAMIANSDAGNGEKYTRLVEEGYRRFWRDYCAGTRRQ
jgi:tetratricopeptide (TPR) repeat protein